MALVAAASRANDTSTAGVRGVRDGDEDAFFGDAGGGGDVRWRHGAGESPGGETYA